jgi:hypothetical protein
MYRVEVSHGVQMKPVPNECHCCDIPPHVSVQCVHCAEIKEEIVFLKNEIRRSCMSYGLEVAETLETNPLFGETVDKLVFRAHMLENVLLAQITDPENRTADEDNATPTEPVSMEEPYKVYDDVPDDVSELSYEEEEEEEEEEEQEEDNAPPRKVNIISLDDSDDEETDPNMFSPKTSRGLIRETVNNNIRKIIVPTNTLRVNIPQPQPEQSDDESEEEEEDEQEEDTKEDTEDEPEEEEEEGEEIESLTREISKVTVSVQDSSANEFDVGNKRKRSSSPELWLYSDAV